MLRRGGLGPLSPSQPEPPEQLAEEAQHYWSASREREDMRDLSHWRGHGRWSEEQWRRIGERHFDLYSKLCTLASRPSRARTMLEWGPGGGANAQRFASEVDTFVAVDISPPNLEECRRQLEVQGFSGFRGILIDAKEPEGVLEHVAEASVDLFLSTAVFQHFPGKDYGVHVTRLAARLLATDGVALIQTRYDDGSETYRPKVRDYRSNAITFTSYGIEEYWELAAEASLHALAVVLDPSVHYAFYLLSRRPAGAKGLSS